MSYNLSRDEYSSPEHPLDVASTTYYPPAVYYLRVPDPRGLTLSQVQRELQSPSVGRAVTVEFIVSISEDSVRWAFRYLWADWSIAVEFERDEERWEFMTKGAGPRTELQLRELYELADHLRVRQSAERVQKSWADVRRSIWPKKRASNSDSERTALLEKELDEAELNATIKLKLDDAKRAYPWRGKHDPETIVLEGFMQGLIPSERVCDLFSLDRHKSAPVLAGLRAAYESLVKVALVRRSRAISKAYRRRRITLNQASDLLTLDWPITEHILGINLNDRRGSKTIKRPSKKKLLESINSIEATKMAGLAGS